MAPEPPRHEPRAVRVFDHRRGTIVLRSPAVVGILNVTPDSFSDGGRWMQTDRAVEHALRMFADGATVVDVGGESARPGAAPVSEDEELRRVIPVIEAIRARHDGILSVDTTRARVAREAIQAGADIVNDISAFTFDPDIARVTAEAGAGCVLMHTPGRPDVMMSLARWNDITQAVTAWLAESLARAVAAGVRPTAIALDPGFGFGKLPDDNFRLLRELRRVVDLGCPVLVGMSRKTMLREHVGTDLHALDHASTAANLLAMLNGAELLRVHDVAAAVAAVRIHDAWRTAG